MDNLDALVARVESVWTANGWDKTELFYFVMPSHPIPSDTVLATYRAIAKTWVARRQADKRWAQSSFIDLSQITSSAELLALGTNGYLGGNDYNHLSSAGGAYDLLTRRVVSLIPTVR